MVPQVKILNNCFPREETKQETYSLCRPQLLDALRIDAGDKAGSREEEAIAEAWGRDAGGLEQGGGRGMVSSGLTVGRF